MSFTMENTQGYTQEELAALSRWIAAAKNAPGWLGGYGLGRSYIDSRTRGGRGYAARRGYVLLDHEVARVVPNMAGRHWSEVESVVTAGVVNAP